MTHQSALCFSDACHFQFNRAGERALRPVMKTVFKIAGIVVGAPLLVVFLIAFLIFLANRSGPSDEDIRSSLSEHASNKLGAIDWLQSANRSFSDVPLTESDKRNLREFAYNLWGTGVTYDDVKGASSVIDVSFQTRGEVPGMFYGTHQLRCWLLFDENGQLVLSRFQSMYL